MEFKNTVIFDYSNLMFRLAYSVIRDENIDLLPYKAFLEVTRVAKEMKGEMFEGEPTDVVLAVDAGNYWRKKIYQPYKANRAKRRAEDGIDWDRVFEAMDFFIDNINTYTPWYAIKCDECEADDVIYVYSKEASKSGKMTVIVSSDSDYLQLMKYKGVFVYTPMQNSFRMFPYLYDRKVECSTPEEYLKYAILTGQGGKDNVYNVKTPTDFSGPRKPGFGVVAAAKFVSQGDNMQAALEKAGLYDNYMRNKTLIDMECLPAVYYDAIVKQMGELTGKTSRMEDLLTKYFWPSLNPVEYNTELSDIAGIQIAEVSQKEKSYVPDEGEDFEF